MKAISSSSASSPAKPASPSKMRASSRMSAPRPPSQPAQPHLPRRHRHAQSDEVLTKITEQLETDSATTHGIALLDYTTRELVIQAESGARRGALASACLSIPALSARWLAPGKPQSTAHSPTIRVARSPSSLTPPPPWAFRFSTPTIFTASCTSKLWNGGLLRGRISPPPHSRRPHLRRAPQRSHLPESAGAGHHRRPHRCQNSPLFYGSALFRMERSSRASRSFALVLMDLDRFKFVNDFYGHLEGDLVLQRVGQILETNCRRSDVVARYAATEFVILMPETSMEQARQLSSKLRGWVAADPLLREKNISASFGIACYPLHALRRRTHPGRRRVHVSFEASGRQHRLHRRSRRPQRSAPLEARRSRSLSWRHSQAPLHHRPRSLRRNLSPPPQFTDSLPSTEIAQDPPPEGPRALPQSILDTVTSLAYAIDAKDHTPRATRKKFPPTPRFLPKPSV